MINKEIMELVAIWVEEYRKFQNQTFNLDHPIDFIFDFDKDKRVMHISSKEKRNYVSLFKEPIVGVTAIVGKNAAGKSSFLKLLNVIKTKKPLGRPVVLIFHKLNESQESAYEVFLYQHLGMAFDTAEKRAIYDISLGKHLESLEKLSRLKINKTYDGNPFDKIDILNYDNLFSNENDKLLHEDTEKTNDTHIYLNRKMMYQVLSTLDKESLKKYIDDFDEKKKESSILSNNNFNPLKLYFDHKLHDRLTFLSEVKQDSSFPKHIVNKVNLPKTISLWFESDILVSCKELFEKETKKQKLLTAFNIFALTYINQIASKSKLKEAFKIRVFLQIINAAVTYEKSIEAKQTNSLNNDFFQLLEQKKVLNGDDISFSEDVLNELIKLLTTGSNEKSKKFFQVLILYNFNHLILKIDDLIDSISITSDVLSLYGFYSVFELNIDSSTWKIVKLFLDVNVFGWDKFINISFPNLSSGEDALLNLYTELYNGLKLVKKESDLIVAIDEGETHLHPEWQREYLSSLLEFIGYYANQKNINVQLILTSHSPFILSDLTKDQVVFLKHNDDANRSGISVNRECQTETFGANIYDLFKDSFFMEKGFIGEFAKQKIDKVFDDLIKGREQISDARKLEMEQVIRVIGEPLMKRQLSKMFDKLYQTDLEVKAINEQIKRLEKIRDKKTKE
jgi:hypothetical protein